MKPPDLSRPFGSLTPRAILLLGDLFQRRADADAVAAWWALHRSDLMALGWRLIDHPTDPHLRVPWGTGWVQYDLIRSFGPGKAPEWHLLALHDRTRDA